MARVMIGDLGRILLEVQLVDILIDQAADMNRFALQGVYIAAV